MYLISNSQSSIIRIRDNDNICVAGWFLFCFVFYWKRYKGENATDMVPSVSLNLYSLVKHFIYIQFFRNFWGEKSKTTEIIRWNEWGKGARSLFIFWTRRYDVAPKGAPWQMCPTSFGTNVVRVHPQDLEAAMLWNYGIQGQGQQLLQWETWQDVTLCPSCTWSRSQGDTVLSESGAFWGFPSKDSFTKPRKMNGFREIINSLTTHSLPNSLKIHTLRLSVLK